MLRKIFKMIGLVILVIFVLILLFLGLVWAAIEWGQSSKKQEKMEYQKEVCDTTTIVKNQFAFDINGFSKKELKKVNFYIIRNQKVWRDSAVKVEFDTKDSSHNVALPFETFLTSDTVIVKVANRYFLLSDLHYTASQNYGMFGPVGPCECHLGDFEMLNGKAPKLRSGWLDKKDGTLDYKLPSKIND